MKRQRFTISTPHLVALAVIIAAAILIYSVVIPTVVANHYMHRLARELNTTDKALQDVAARANLPLFTEPDISLPTRSAQLQDAIGDVKRAQDALTRLSAASQLTTVPGGDVADDYRMATVRHNQSQNMVNQSRQVLDEYHQLLKYLDAYTNLQIKLDERLNSFNAIQNFGTLTGDGAAMLTVGNTLRADAKTVETLPPPAGFEALKTEAVSTFNRAADGFHRLGRGLNTGKDAEIYGAVGWLEAVSLKNEINDKDLLVTLADSSPTLRQVADLPEKAESALGR